MIGYAVARLRALRRHRGWLLARRADLVAAKRVQAVLIAYATIVMVRTGYLAVNALVAPLSYFDMFGFYVVVAIVGNYLAIEGWRQADVRPQPIVDPIDRDWRGTATEWMRRIEEHGWRCDSDLDLTKLARRLGTNTTYLSRGFNEGLGLGFAEAIKGMRVEHVVTHRHTRHAGEDASYCRTDGGNDPRKVADLGIPGDADQPAFDVLRALLFPSSASSARVAVRIGGRIATIACPFMTAATRDFALRHPSKGSPYGWTFEVRGNVGVLTMPTWAVFHDKWDWRGFIDASMDAAIERNLSGIVTDVRDNGGGLNCGSAIIARLIASPLAADSFSRHVRYRKIPDRFSPYLKTWDRSFKDWGASAIGPDAAGFYAPARPGDATDTDIIQPAGRRFAGKIARLSPLADGSGMSESGRSKERDDQQASSGCARRGGHFTDPRIFRHFYSVLAVGVGIGPGHLTAQIMLAACIVAILAAFVIMECSARTLWERL